MFDHIRSFDLRIGKCGFFLCGARAPLASVCPVAHALISSAWSPAFHAVVCKFWVRCFAFSISVVTLVACECLCTVRNAYLLLENDADVLEATQWIQAGTGALSQWPAIRFIYYPTITWTWLKMAHEPVLQAFFRATTRIDLGDGNLTLFWTDNWIQGKSIQTLAPNLWKLVKTRVKDTRTITQGIENNAWVCDIQGSLP